MKVGFSLGGVKKMDLNEALIKAAKNGDMSVLIDALEKSADINAKDKNGWTALMWALKKRTNRDSKFSKAKGCRRR